MSGYLQRLAAGTATVDRPIHPVLPPIFSAAAADANIDHRDSVSRASHAAPQSTASPAESQRSSIAVAPGLAAAATTVAPEAGVPSSPPPPASARVVTSSPLVRDVLRPRIDHRDRDNPARLEQDSEEAGDADGAEKNAINVHTPLPPPPELAEPRGKAREVRTGSTQGEEAPSGRPVRTFAPLLAATVGAQNSRPAEPAAPQSASISASPARREQDARRMSAEPHEVQIHIGRIEVTAVPPAPVRPTVATPRRNAMSLDDYLKRRNGRAS